MKPPPIIEPTKSPTATASKVKFSEYARPEASSGQCKQKKPTEGDILWEKRYNELVRYKEEKGDCNVPRKFDKYPGLGIWVHNQRAFKKQGKLTDERKRKLDDIGFDTDPNATLWNQRYDELVGYKEEYGDCNVPRNFDENPKLGVWVHHQREFKMKGKLTDERKRKLDDIGFDFDPFATAWNKRLNELKQFKSVNGHCKVPKDYDQNPELGNWVVTQRFLKKKDKLCEERVEKLNTLNFTWNPHSELWNSQYEALQEFESKYGDCNVPANFAEDLSLAKWVNHQRTKYKNGEMEQDKINKLTEIDFTWAFYSQTEWTERYNELVLYKRKHNHSKGPVRNSTFSQLSNWIDYQRKKRNELDKRRVKLLNEIGFAWKVSPSRNEWFTSTMKHTAAKPSGFAALKKQEWMEYYNSLKAFKAEYGHFNVPLRYVHNDISLGRWVKFQKELFDELGKLPMYRQRLLEEIGFVFGKKS
eukprot:scaffold66271_cov21-Cyclotella_meneghiniana.AAC.1